MRSMTVEYQIGSRRWCFVGDVNELDPRRGLFHFLWCIANLWSRWCSDLPLARCHHRHVFGLPPTIAGIACSITFRVKTGKGPLRDNFEALVAKAAFQKIKIVFAWLSFADYATLLGITFSVVVVLSGLRARFWGQSLGCADLGVSLHVSSSGVDLPMKVVDMFGTGLPVCSMDYECIHELVQDRQNGWLVQNASDMATCFKVLSHLPSQKLKKKVFCKD